MTLNIGNVCKEGAKMYEEEYGVIDLSEIIFTLKNHLKWLIIVPICFAVVGALVSIWLVDPVYEASTTIIVRQEKGFGEEIDINDVNLGKGLIYTYAEMAKSNTVIENTAKKLQTDKISRDIVTVAPIKDTQILKITVRNTDPILASDVANTLVEEFTKEVIRITKINNVAVVDYATVPKTPIKPNKLMNILISAVIGEVFLVISILVKRYMDNTIKSEGDIEKYIGIPTIGSIPNFNQRSKNGHGRVYGKRKSQVNCNGSL